jgi:ATP-binding cassette subfamily B (MDR/TAP) protein 1
MELTAYSKAGSIAEEVFSSIRTVVCYNGQEREEKRFHFNKRYSHCYC